jgi:5'-methylthioadenosine phosphorylase
MAQVKVGIIGGSGLGEALGALGQGATQYPDTPFGKPAAPIVETELGGVPVALLSRHGEGHRFSPSRVPYRANIWALKQLGCTHVLASAAVGSLREAIAPKHLVIPDQVIDLTTRRDHTFFDELAVHAELASPFCPTLRSLLLKSAEGLPTQVHVKGTLVVMEGPQFSTRAESERNRMLGGDLIGMTAMPEAKLAREAELCYALVSLPTDYDCWRPAPDHVDKLHLLEEIIGNLKAATANALDLLRRAVPGVKGLEGACACQSALALGIWTDKQHIAAETRQRLDLLLGKYLH